MEYLQKVVKMLLQCDKGGIMTLFIKKSEAAEHKYTNRLAREKSPYLLQHAHNPVDWYAWGEEAFEKARKENKPILDRKSVV